MFKHDYMKINNKNHLEIDGIDTVDVAVEFGTPLYLFSEERIRDNMQRYKAAIDKFYGGRGLALYASKAFSCIYMYRLAAKMGFGVDVVSGGELYTALRAGFDATKIVFHGNNKSFDELLMAINAGVGRIVADSYDEILTIDKISAALNKKSSVMIRVKPGVEAHTHEFISTGQIDSKFGFAIENGEAYELAKMISACEHINLTGIHCHLGSQMFLHEPFCLGAKVMMEFYIKLQRELGLPLGELNLGGGFGIKYTDDDTPANYEEYIDAVSSVICDICYREDVEVPFIYMEPGRSIVGDAGITLYTAGSIKDIKGVRKYVSVDGGMADNPRYIMYDAKYDAILANRAADEPSQTLTICGKCCESGDVLIKDAYLPDIKRGDIIAVMSTGAYNYSMASNYNRLPRPAAAVIADGRARLIIKRESYDDIIKNDIF